MKLALAWEAFKTIATWKNAKAGGAAMVSAAGLAYAVYDVRGYVDTKAEALAAAAVVSRAEVKAQADIERAAFLRDLESQKELAKSRHELVVNSLGAIQGTLTGMTRRLEALETAEAPSIGPETRWAAGRGSPEPPPSKGTP